MNPTRLALYQQTCNSCLIISAGLILQSLTNIPLTDHIDFLLNQADHLYIDYNIPRNTTVGNTNEEVYCNLYVRSAEASKGAFEFSNQKIADYFTSFCENRRISIKRVEIMPHLTEIENIIRTEPAYLSLSYKHNGNKWHITPVGYFEGQFYSVDTNTRSYVLLGNTINNILPLVGGTEIGDGILFVQK